MRLIIALILSALGTCQAGAEDRGKQLAAVDITPASAVEDHVRDGAPNDNPRARCAGSLCNDCRRCCGGARPDQRSPADCFGATLSKSSYP